MKPTLPALACLVLSVACVTPPDGGRAPRESRGGEKTEDPTVELESLRRERTIAELELAQARLRLETHETTSQDRLAAVAEELEQARAREVQFVQASRPNRLERSQQALTRARDRATESDEELKQLQIMYDEQDLDDMTKEFVIARGQRDAERTQAALALQEREHVALKDHELPLEARKLAFDVERKQQAVLGARVEVELEGSKLQVALLRAEAKLDEATRKLEAAEEKAGADAGDAQ